MTSTAPALKVARQYDIMTVVLNYSTSRRMDYQMASTKVLESAPVTNRRRGPWYAFTVYAARL